MIPKARVVLAALAIVGLSSCATVLGIEDVPTPADSGSDSDSGSATDSASDSDSDSASASDSCPGVPENCTNGIDDDCNGATDCADPSCGPQGYACVPKVDQGWTYEPIDPTHTASCPAGFGIQDLVAGVTGAPASCGCVCSQQPPSCTYGSVMAGVGVSACGESSLNLTVDGTCVAVQGVTPNLLSAMPPTPVGGSCTPSPTKSVPNATRTRWLGCSYSGALGGGCDAGKACGFVGTAFKACVTKNGNASCPSGYGTSTVVGTDVTDTRSCTSCSCGGPAALSCSQGVLSFYLDGACTVSPEPFIVNGSCQSNAGGVNYKAYKYTAMADITCGAPTTPSTPTGDVTLANTLTTCCAP